MLILLYVETGLLMRMAENVVTEFREDLKKLQLIALGMSFHRYTTALEPGGESCLKRNSLILITIMHGLGKDQCFGLWIP